eukprot:1594299-Pyramimonas_sp.AAC.1
MVSTWAVGGLQSWHVQKQIQKHQERLRSAIRGRSTKLFVFERYFFPNDRECLHCSRAAEKLEGHHEARSI